MFSRRFLFAILILGVIVAFQNCGGFRASDAGQLLADLKLQGGNGGGYDGKRSGTFYRYVPNHLCSGQAAPQAIAEIRSEEAFLYDNSQEQCAQTSTPISASDLDFSPFQNDFISVQDNLFKRYDQKPAGIPQDLAEILCRDDFANPTFEIVTHFDRETSEAKARVYFAENMENDFSIGRVLSSTDVSYVSEKLQFSVDLSKTTLPKKKFSGLVHSSQLAGLSGKKLICVIGGALDNSNWKFIPVSELPTSGIYLSGQSDLLIPFSISQWSTHLYQITADQTKIDFTKKHFGDQFTFRAFQDERQKNLTFLQMRSTSEIFDSTYVYQTIVDRVTKLTNLHEGPAQGTLLIEPVLTSNNHLIYREYNNNAKTTSVYNLDLNQETPVLVATVNRPLNLLTLPSANLAVFLPEKSERARTLQIYDVTTGKISSLDVQIPATCYLDPQYPLSTPRDVSLVLHSVCGETVEIIEVMLADGTIRKIANNARIQWIADDKSWIFLGDTNRRTAFSTDTGRSFEMPINPELKVFSGASNDLRYRTGNVPQILNSRWMYGFGDELEVPSLYQVDLTTGASTKQCQNALGKKVLVGKLANERIYLFTFDSALKLYRFYVVKNGEDCILLNQFPSRYAAVPWLDASSIGFTLQLSDLPYESAKEIVFVPADGRPPLKLNWQETGSWEAKVSQDLSRIFVLGPTADATNKIFSFRFF